MPITFSVSEGESEFLTEPGSKYDVTQHSITMDKRGLIERINTLKREIKETKETNRAQQSEWKEKEARLKTEIDRLKERNALHVENMNSTVESNVRIALASIQQQLESKVRELAELQHEKQESDIKTTALETLNDNYSKEIETKDAENTELKNDNAQLNFAQRELANKNTTLSTELKIAQNDLREVSQQKFKLEQAIEDLKSNLVASEENDNLVNDIKGEGNKFFADPSFRQKSSESDREFITRFIHNLININQEKAALLQIATAENTEKQQVITAYKNTIDDYKKSNTSFENSNAELNQAVATLEEQNQNLRLENIRLSEKNRQLEHNDVNREALVITNNQQAQTIEGKQNIIDRLNSELQTQKAEAATAHREYETAMLNASTEHAAKIQDLTNQLNAKDEEKDEEIAALRKTIQLALTDNARKDRDNSELVDNINRANKLNYKLQEAKNAAEAGLDERIKLVSKLFNDNKDLTAQLESAQAQNSNLEEAATRQEKNNTDLRTQLENAQAQNSNLEEAATQQEKNNTDLTAQIENRQAEINRLTGKLEEANTEREKNNTDLTAQLEISQAQNSNLKEAATQQERNNTTLITKLEGVQARIDELTGELTELTEANARLTEKANAADELAAANRDLSLRNTALTNDSNERDMRINELTSKLATANADLETLRKDLIKAKTNWDFTDNDLKGGRKRSRAQREFSTLGLKVLQDADNSDLDIAESEDESEGESEDKNGKQDQPVQDADNRTSGIASKFRKSKMELGKSGKSKKLGKRKSGKPKLNFVLPKGANLDQEIQLALAKGLTKEEQEFQNQLNTPTPLDMVLF